MRVPIPAVLVALVLVLASCAHSRIKDKPEWKTYFDKHGISEACFMLRDQTHEVISYYNEDRCLRQFTPASTFKILNSLIALETGAAPDEQLVIAWDSISRSHTEWNRDMNMRKAFEVSNVPYYQELARRIRMDRMKHYIDTIKYGNMELGAHVDSFWLDNSLRISADEQLGFVKRLYFNELKGFSERSQRIVRSMMLREETPDYRLYYKTGTGIQEGKMILWVVGYVEKIVQVQEHEKAMNKSNVRIIPYFFTQNFEVAADDTSADWGAVRVQIVKEILRDLRILPEAS